MPHLAYSFGSAHVIRRAPLPHALVDGGDHVGTYARSFTDLSIGCPGHTLSDMGNDNPADDHEEPATNSPCIWVPVEIKIFSVVSISCPPPSLK